MILKKLQKIFHLEIKSKHIHFGHTPNNKTAKANDTQQFLQEVEVEIGIEILLPMLII